MQEFFQEIRERYRSLSEEEKDIIRAMVGTAQGRVLAKILGPDIMAQINFRKPSGPTKKRGLATR